MKKVVVLFDLAEAPPPDQDFRNYIKDDDWASEIHVKRALQRLGYEAILMGLYDDISRFVRELNEIKPDFVFNLCESFHASRDFEPQVAGVLDLLGIPYTGCKTLALALCKDKALSKKILAHHRIRVPRWIISPAERPLKKLGKMAFPAFIKPTRTEGSEGIAKNSLVENERDALDRIKFLHEKFSCDVMIEEFISGRELYASALGKRRVQIFPLRELLAHKKPDDEPRIATYRVKWDENYRKKWGIRNQMAKELPKNIEKQAFEMAKKAFQVLGLSGYARFDLRLREDNELVMLEANPNPSLADWDDFAKSAEKVGFSYDGLIQKIIDLA